MHQNTENTLYFHNFPGGACPLAYGRHKVHLWFKYVCPPQQFLDTCLEIIIKLELKNPIHLSLCIQLHLVIFCLKLIHISRNLRMDCVICKLQLEKQFSYNDAFTPFGCLLL